MPYLMKLSFGPVQDFIASARKLEDLWAGSDILSQIMEAVLKELKENYQAEIIYPYLPDENDRVNCPNILLCQINDSDLDLKDLADKLAKKASDALNEIVSTQIENATKPDKFRLFKHQIEEQTNKFLQIAWACQGLDQESEVDSQIRELDATFDAVKRTRQFAKAEAKGVKCTLQTNLSVLFPQGRSYSDSAAREFWSEGLKNCFKGNAIKYIKIIRTRKGERFSSIGLAKRLYRRGNSLESPFPSTYSVATAKWRADVLTRLDKLKECLDTFYDKVKEASEDPTLNIFKTHRSCIPQLKQDASGYLDIVEWEPQVLLETDSIEPLKKDPLASVRKNLHQAAKELNLGPPPGHYALLLADGDSMGELVDSQPLPQRTELSQKLWEFASEAIGKTKGLYGRMIYAGGDDLMAVVPVENALSLACQWRNAYCQHMSSYDQVSVRATLSVALMVAPIDYPLNRLLQRAEHTLKFAAKDQDKDSLAIDLYKGTSLAASVVLPTEYARNGFKWDLASFSQDGRENRSIRSMSAKSLYDLNKDLLDLSSLVPSRKPEDVWRLAGKMAKSRLCTMRGLSESGATDSAEWVDRFIKAMDGVSQLRGNDRFRRPELLGQTLLTLEKMWKMWGTL